jgi:hypothetical protein
MKHIRKLRKFENFQLNESDKSEGKLDWINIKKYKNIK